MQLSNSHSQEVLTKAELASAALEDIVANSGEISRQNLPLRLKSRPASRVR